MGAFNLALIFYNILVSIIVDTDDIDDIVGIVDTDTLDAVLLTANLHFNKKYVWLIEVASGRSAATALWNNHENVSANCNSRINENNKILWPIWDSFLVTIF